MSVCAHEHYCTRSTPPTQECTQNSLWQLCLLQPLHYFNIAVEAGSTLPHSTEQCLLGNAAFESGTQPSNQQSINRSTNFATQYPYCKANGSPPQAEIGSAEQDRSRLVATPSSTLQSAELPKPGRYLSGQECARNPQNDKRLRRLLHCSRQGRNADVDSQFSSLCLQRNDATRRNATQRTQQTTSYHNILSPGRRSEVRVDEYCYACAIIKRARGITVSVKTTS